MDSASLIRECHGMAGRFLGDPPAWFAVGVGTWSTRAPEAWDGKPYTGQGHGLSLVLEGHGTCTGPDRVTRAVSPGSAVHHLPGLSLVGALPGPAAELWIAFGGPIAKHLAALDLLRREPVLRIGLDPGLFAGFAALHAGLRGPLRPGDGPHLLAQGLAWLHSAYARADADDGTDAWQKRLTEVCRLLRRDLAGPLDLTAIATQVGLTPLVLRRRFRQHLGCSPSMWWRQQRLQRAAQLLQRHPVSEVAQRVGYTDPTALAKQVRRHFGRTPSSFRAVS